MSVAIVHIVTMAILNRMKRRTDIAHTQHLADTTYATRIPIGRSKSMDIIQEIKKRQEKIDANTERIFKLQQQNMKLREEIRKLQRG